MILSFFPNSWIPFLIINTVHFSEVQNMLNSRCAPRRPPHGGRLEQFKRFIRHNDEWFRGKSFWENWRPPRIKYYRRKTDIGLKPRHSLIQGLPSSNLHMRMSACIYCTQYEIAATAFRDISSNCRNFTWWILCKMIKATKSRGKCTLLTHQDCRCYNKRNLFIV